MGVTFATCWEMFVVDFGNWVGASHPSFMIPLLTRPIPFSLVDRALCQYLHGLTRSRQGRCVNLAVVLSLAKFLISF